jgi:cephalosporin-C deacetylase
MKTLTTASMETLGGAPDAPPVANPIRVSLNRRDGLYACGEQARVVVSLDGGAGTLAVPSAAKITLVRDFVVPLGEREWHPAEGPLTLEVTLDEPGQVMATVSLGGQSEERPDSRKSVGLLFGSDAFVPAAPEPDDFDAFWSRERRDWMRRVRRPVLTAGPAGDSAVELWDVRIPIEGDRPVTGYLARPQGARSGSCPAVLLLHSASGYLSADSGLTAEFAARGFVALDVTPHGLPNGQPETFYGAAQQAAGNFRMEGLGSRETWYFKGMFLRVAAALDYLAGRPEWNGALLGIFGSSMGGAQALAGAALDPRVTALALNVPAMCDLLPSPPRAGAWPRPLNDATRAAFGRETIARTVSYFDMVYFARRVKAAVTLTVGLIDATCPACGLMTMVNQLPGPVGARVYPELKHGWVPNGREALYEVLAQHARSGAQRAGGG